MRTSEINLPQSFFPHKGVKYLFTLNNWLEVTLYVLTLVTLVRPRSEDISEMGICVFLVWIVLLQYISK